MLYLLATCLLWMPAETDSDLSQVDTVLVCSKDHLRLLAPWIRLRTEQGHRVGHVSGAGSALEIRQRIREVARHKQLKHVVLVGDTPTSLRLRQARTQPDARPAERGPLAEPSGEWASGWIPPVATHFARAKVNVRWGSEPEIATDNWYADLDDDQIPELAIGRISVTTEAELKTVVEKILQYEQHEQRGEWLRRLNFIAGVGGFGAIADSVLEMTTKQFLTDGIPACYSTSMTYGSWRSPYCPDPNAFHDVTCQRFNEGCLFWVYIGHGQRTYLDRVRVPGKSYHILSTQDVVSGKMKVAEGLPIAIFLACYTGAFDEPQDCIAESLLRAPGGPVAVYSGSRVTMPYAMAVMGNALLDGYFRDQQPTLGELVLAAKRRMVARTGRSTKRFMLDMIAKVVSPEPELMADERAEHLSLFNLIGDPLLRLPYPQTVELDAPDRVTARTQITVASSEKFAEGEYWIELACRRDQTRNALPARPRYQDDASSLREYTTVYSEANNPVWVRQPARLVDGQLNMALSIPESAEGPAVIRLVGQAQDQLVLGAKRIFIDRPAIEDADADSGRQARSSNGNAPR